MRPPPIPRHPPYPPTLSPTPPDISWIASNAKQFRPRLQCVKQPSRIGLLSYIYTSLYTDVEQVDNPYSNVEIDSKFYTLDSLCNTPRIIESPIYLSSEH
jgi:hypothetical protein